MLTYQRYHLLNDELENYIAEADKDVQSSWLILGPHPDSSTHWIVNCLFPEFYFEFESLIGNYRAVNADTLDAFLELADELGYKVVFEEDPDPLLAAQDRLEDLPPFKLNSLLEGTIEGFLPFQLREFNRLKDLEYGLAVWSTGAGKSVLAGALTLYHLHEIDIAFHIVKRHNLINTQRKLKRLAGLDSLLITGPKPWRTKAYTRLTERLRANEPTVVVLNYEKFRDDFSVNEDGYWDLSEWGKEFFPDRRLLMIYDEMPMKLKNRNSQLYKSVCTCMYDTKPPQVQASKFRPAKAWQYMTSGTPIENNPADAFNCIRLLDKGATFGPVKEFEAEYVKSYNYFNQYEPEEWHKLDKMHLKIHPFLSVVDKRDPEISAMFPDVIEEPIYIDWHKNDRKIYDLITKRAKEALDEDETNNTLALMTVLQMMCDDPTMLNRSAAKRSEFEKTLLEYNESDDKFPTVSGSDLALDIISELGPLSDEHHEKLKYLDRILLERHPGEKTLVFSVFSDLLLPNLSARLDSLQIPHVTYAGTDRQRQAAYDQFKEDKDTLVFLSSDAGSDSIDLEEATVTINYNLPWNYSRKVQRDNRNNRVTTQHETIYSYTFMMNNSIEDRRVEVMANKLGFQEGIFHGVSSEAIKATRLDQGDIYYILTGRSD